MTTEFKVGDKVAVFQPGNIFASFPSAPHHTSTVKRVMTRFIELEDGTQWNGRGKPYPGMEGYHNPYIIPLTEGHVEMLKSRKVWNQTSPLLKKLVEKPESYTLDQLTRLSNLLLTFETEKKELVNKVLADIISPELEE